MEVVARANQVKADVVVDNEAEEEKPLVSVKLNTAVKTVLIYSVLYVIFFVVFML